MENFLQNEYSFFKKNGVHVVIKHTVSIRKVSRKNSEICLERTPMPKAIYLSSRELSTLKLKVFILPYQLLQSLALELWSHFWKRDALYSLFEIRGSKWLVLERGCALRVIYWQPIYSSVWFLSIFTVITLAQLLTNILSEYILRQRTRKLELSSSTELVALTR